MCSSDLAVDALEGARQHGPDAQQQRSLRSPVAARPGAEILAADDDRWNRLLRELHREVIEWHRAGCGAWPAFPERVQRAIEPYNHVGLFDVNAHNMYQHTAPEK